MSKVPKVTSVDLDIPSRDRGHLTVCAIAEVPTLGWSEAQLSPYHYLVPPADGIYDFDFLAKPPSSVAAQQVSALPVALVISNPPGGLRGVRIHAAENELCVRIPHVTSEPAPKGDEITVTKAVVEGNQLVIEVAYAGGFGGPPRHDFELRWTGGYQLSLPPQVEMRLVHNANGDEREARVKETLVFDLLDLGPCIVQLSTSHGFSARLPYGLDSSDSAPIFRAFAGGGLPILTVPLVRLLVELLQDPKSVEAFKSDPDRALKAAGVPDEQIVGLKAGPDQGYAGVLGGALKAIGVRQELLQGISGILGHREGNG